ncbi:hypothetical protein AOLI_G00017440 [Acnodon oligacanthus]
MDVYAVHAYVVVIWKPPFNCDPIVLFPGGANSDNTEPQVDQRPNNSGHDGTCLDPRGKRKKSGSRSSHRKRQRVEVEDTETEDQQVLPTTADGEEGQPSWFVSNDEESSEGQSETDCEPEESQSDQES